jgi:hypothetical protein
MAGYRFRIIRRQARPSALGHWFRIGAATLALLALSEALWMWQTWPVRELLQ